MSIAKISRQLRDASEACKEVCPSSPKIVGITQALRMTRGQIVYVISAPGGFYKVGITKNDVNTRLQTLQTGSPQRLTPEAITAVSPIGVDAAEMERGMHDLLAAYRTSGEWFQAPPAVIGRAWKETWVSLVCPDLFKRWQRYRLHMITSRAEKKARP